LKDVAVRAGVVRATRYGDGRVPPPRLGETTVSAQVQMHVPWSVRETRRGPPGLSAPKAPGETPTLEKHASHDHPRNAVSGLAGMIGGDRRDVRSATARPPNG
jgi:hypothetical protein